MDISILLVEELLINYSSVHYFSCFVELKPFCVNTSCQPLLWKSSNNKDVTVSFKQVKEFNRRKSVT
jgi:hypothetical protein